jgi:hypothetical protein
MPPVYIGCGRCFVQNEEEVLVAAGNEPLSTFIGYEGLQLGNNNAHLQFC